MVTSQCVMFTYTRISHFNETNLVYILIKQYKWVSFIVHYKGLTLR